MRPNLISLMQHWLCVFVFFSVFNWVPVELKGSKRNFVLTSSQGLWYQEPLISPYQARKAAQLSWGNCSGMTLPCHRRLWFIFMRYFLFLKWVTPHFPEQRLLCSCVGSCLFLPRCWCFSLLPGQAISALLPGAASAVSSSCLPWERGEHLEEPARQNLGSLLGAVLTSSCWELGHHPCPQCCCRALGWFSAQVHSCGACHAEPTWVCSWP